MIRRTFCLAGLVVVCGCGGDQPGAAPAKNVVNVSGTLTYQGKPLENFSISFVPADEGKHTAFGMTDSSGNFKLGTNLPGDGAAVGKYKIGVTYSGPTDVSDSSVTASPIDDVKQMPKPPVKIPAHYADPETSQMTQDVPPGGLTDLKIDLK
jgi:hypothetical protein